MEYVLTILTVVMGVYYIWFDHTTLFKLIPMVLIIIFACIQVFSKREKRPYQLLTVIGLLFCISGDYLINQVFVYGLFAFLVGHIFYIFSFKQQIKAKPDGMRWVILAYALIMIVIMSTALIRKEDWALVGPVILYTVIIATMTYFAWRTKNKWLMIGSILFLISDSILAWNKFVTSFEASSALIMITYYSANYFIARSLRNEKISN